MICIQVAHRLALTSFLLLHTTTLLFPTPTAAWQSLKTENIKFVKNKKLSKQRVQFVDVQKPTYIVLGCSDSRVPPELIFNQTFGSFFVVRTAGHVVDNLVIDSIEYAVSHFSPSVIVVLGHTNCGAVTGALKHLKNNNGVVDVPCNHLCAVLIPIEQTILQAKINRDEPNALALAIQANVRSAADKLMANSSIIKNAVNNNTLIVVGAEYSLQTGEVTELFIIKQSPVESDPATRKASIQNDTTNP